MLFNWKAGENVFEQNPDILTVKEFVDLTDRQMKYVILSCDYKTPFRGLPIKDKKENAAIEAGYKWDSKENRGDKNTRSMIDGKVKSVENARIKYKSIQFDFDKDLLEAIDSQIEFNKELLRKKDKDPREMVIANKLLESQMVKMAEQRKQLLTVLDLRVEDIVEEEEKEGVVEIKRSRLDVINIKNTEKAKNG